MFFKFQLMSMLTVQFPALEYQVEIWGFSMLDHNDLLNSRCHYYRKLLCSSLDPVQIYLCILIVGGLHICEILFGHRSHPHEVIRREHPIKIKNKDISSYILNGKLWSDKFDPNTDEIYNLTLTIWNKNVMLIKWELPNDRINIQVISIMREINSWI